MKPFPIFLALAAIGVFVAHWLAFVFVPMEATMGASQRIFYFHVPSAWLFYLGIVVCFVASLGYLLNRRARWDAVAASAAEVALTFGVVVLLTGPLWAKAAWGTYWKWEPRLTSMAILFLIFCGYQVLRSFGGNGSSVRVFAAALAVFGGPQIYFVHVAVDMMGGDHPPSVSLEPQMRMVLYANLGILMLVFILLLRLRYRVRRDALTVAALKRRLARIGGA